MTMRFMGQAPWSRSIARSIGPLIDTSDAGAAARCRGRIVAVAGASTGPTRSSQPLVPREAIEDMSKLGTKKKPLVLRVRSLDRMQEVAQRCYEVSAYFIIGIEEDKPEDLTDLERYLRKPKPTSVWRLR
jgi:hypothetical protein